MEEESDFNSACTDTKVLIVRGEVDKKMDLVLDRIAHRPIHV
jgi:hypothetical protein